MHLGTEDKLILGFISIPCILLIISICFSFMAYNNHIKSEHKRVWSSVNQDYIWVDKNDRY